jgi:anti-sigma-K factor RskA
VEQELLRDQCQLYLLGALEGQELSQLQQLIDQRDPETLAALDEARELLAQFAFVAPVVEPPATLRNRVLSMIEPETQNIVSIERARRRPNVLTWGGWAVAAALLIGAILLQRNTSQLEFELARARDEYTQLRTRMGRDAAEYRQVMAILSAGDARSIRLASTAQAAPQLRAFWSGPEGLVLVGSNIPTPATGRTMQLWVLPKSGRPISAGVFQPDPQGRVVMIANTTAAIDASMGLAISDEPEGGSEQPTTQPGWVGKLSD